MASYDSRGKAVAVQAFLFLFFFFGELSSVLGDESEAEPDEACFLFFFLSAFLCFQ